MLDYKPILTSCFEGAFFFNNNFQEELQQETDEVVNELLKSNSCRSSPKLESAMNECLRAYTPSPALLCKAKDDVTIGNFVIPSGVNILFYIGYLANGMSECNCKCVRMYMYLHGLTLFLLFV